MKRGSSTIFPLLHLFPPEMSPSISSGNSTKVMLIQHRSTSGDKLHFDKKFLTLILCDLIKIHLYKPHISLPFLLLMMRSIYL